MKLKTIFYVILVPLAFYACNGNESFIPKDADSEGTHSVNGLLYLDGEPVSIEIDRGEIVAIRHLSSESELPEYYVAPGLIDIQINGYLGIDYS